MMTNKTQQTQAAPAPRPFSHWDQDELREAMMRDSKREPDRCPYMDEIRELMADGAWRAAADVQRVVRQPAERVNTAIRRLLLVGALTSRRTSASGARGRIYRATEIGQ